MPPRSSNSQKVNLYVRKQLLERHRDLETLESECRLTGMTSTDYRSCRRSLLQAINELEAMLPTKGQEN
jgi:hypothetical protein